MMRRIGILVGLLMLCGPAAAMAQSDLTVHSFNCPGGNTRCYRVHANTSNANVTIHGDVVAAGGYKVAYTYAHTGNIVSSLSNNAMPIAGTAGTRTGDVSGVSYQQVPTAGYIVGVAIQSSGAITTGTAVHAEATILRGSTVLATGLRAVIGAGLDQTQYASNSSRYGDTPFIATDRIGCRLSSDASMAPATAQIACTVIVVY